MSGLISKSDNVHIKSLKILFPLLLASYVASDYFTPVANIVQFDDIIPILTANTLADVLIMFMTFTGVLFDSDTLTNWYKEYGISAVIADTLIGVIYLILATMLFPVFMGSLPMTLFNYTLFAIAIQVVLDYAFYIFFMAVPEGNKILDFFKGYAAEVGVGALYGDAALVAVGCLVSAYLVAQEPSTNMLALFTAMYLVPFALHMR